MPIFKNEDTKTWYVMARYTDWKGERKQKCKRGFATRKEALEWEREFLQQKQADVEMLFDSFVELYTKDIKPRLKENTWLTKESIIQKKILPYFGKRKLCDITAKDVINWQNEIRSTKDDLATVPVELGRIEAGAGVDEDLLDTIHLISAIMDGMKEDADGI